MSNNIEARAKTIFISYCWADSEVANQIQKNLDIPGLNIIRDIKMEYKDSIFNFMKQIKNEDYALLLISDNYLKSLNCMREVLEILEENNFSQKILPIILPNTKIFKPEHRIDIIKYWEKNIENLNSKIRELNSLTNTEEIIVSINLYQQIRNSIDNFVIKIIELNCKSFQELIDVNFKPILDHIGVSEDIFFKEIIRISNIKNSTERELEIEKALDVNPKNGNLIFLKANLALEEEKLEIAKRLYERLLIKNQISEIYNNLGICLDKLGLYNDAKLQYENAIQLGGLWSTPYNNLALLLDEKYNDNITAEIYYQKSLEIEYSSSETHYNIANLYHNTGNYTKAKYHYEEAIKFTDNSTKVKLSSIYFNFSNLLFNKLKKFDEAKINYLNCLQLNPSHYEARCNFATLLKNHFNDYNEALIQFQEALKINPKDSISLNNIGNLYLNNLQNKTLAEFHFIKAIEFDDRYAYPHYNLGMLYFEDDYYKAKENFEKAIKINPNYSAAYFNLAKLIKLKGHDKELAKKYYLNAITNDFRFYSPANNILFDINSINIII